MNIEMIILSNKWMEMLGRPHIQIPLSGLRDGQDCGGSVDNCAIKKLKFKFHRCLT